jgi:DNA-binding CsgD family transcriptional regulator
MQLVAEELGNRDIADQMNLSEHALRKHLFRISTRHASVAYPSHKEWA